MRKVLTGSAQERLFFIYLGHIAKLSGVVTRKHLRQLEEEMRSRRLASLTVDWVAEAFATGKTIQTAMLQEQLRKVTSTGTKEAWLIAGWRMVYCDEERHSSSTSFIQQQAMVWKVDRLRAGQLQSLALIQHQKKRNNLSRRHSALAVLGLEYSAQRAEIKRAYRRLSSQLHPDKLVALRVDSARIQQATEQLIQVQEAYRYLIGSR